VNFGLSKLPHDCGKPARLTNASSELTQTSLEVGGTIVAQSKSRRRGSTLIKPMKIERILCPTNLSPESDAALEYAIAVARTYSAELVLLHCSVMVTAWRVWIITIPPHAQLKLR
jgi:hypothetical protein